MHCLTEHVFVILGGGCIIESMEIKGYGSLVIGLGCAYTSHHSHSPSNYCMHSVSILYAMQIKSVDNLSVTFKSLSLQSRHAEYWGLKCSFTSLSDRMQK